MTVFGLVTDGIDIVPLATTSRGGPERNEASDGFDAQVAALGPEPAFGVVGSGSLLVPTAALNPTRSADGAATGVLLVQDTLTGLWHWDLGTDEPAGRRFQFEIPPGETTRGPLGAAARWVVKGIGSAFGDRVIGTVTDWAVQRWEEKHRPPTLRWFGSPEAMNPGDLSGPSLLLLHDIFGRSESSFASLPEPFLTAIRARYGNRIWTYEHPTLATSPDENAAELLKLLGPARGSTRVDVLAHGRGGLVALALAQHGGDGLDLGRIVLAGTPIRGTRLCDADHLTALANRYTNLLSLIPDNPVTTTLDAVSALVIQVAHHAAKGLPGLGAMAGGFTGALPVGPTWSLVGGHCPKGGPVFERLRDAVVDALLEGPSDLLVPVASALAADVDAVRLPSAEAHHRSLWVPDHVAAIQAELDQIPIELPTSPSTASQPEPVTEGPPSTRRARVYRRSKPIAEDTSDATTSADVVVTAMHASLEHARGILIVGHYLGSEISGAEASLDTRLNGALNTRHVARLYPQESGDSVYFENSSLNGGNGYPSAAIVVGLGEPGRLSRSVLAETVASGLLRHALDLIESSAPDANLSALTVSPMLVGTRGTSPLPIESSVAAIVNGVLSANERLSDLPQSGGIGVLFDRVRYVAIEFIEIHLDRAELAAHAVAKVDVLVTNRAKKLSARGKGPLSAGEGGWPARSALDNDPGWNRVVIRSRSLDGTGGREELTYTSVGSRSLTETLSTEPNRQVVDALLTEIVRDGPTSKANGYPRSLFEALVPAGLRDDVVVSDNLQFIVDAGSARYPWEAIVAGLDVSDDKPTAARGLIRQFIDTEGHRGRARLGVGRTALVIGAPPSSPHPYLAGAFAEATEIAALLADEANGFPYKVKLLKWHADGTSEHIGGTTLSDSSAEIFNALARPARILHIAAHGLGVGPSGEGGVVIGENNSLLTAKQVEELTNVPELVVLNCCELGANPGLAANLARAFMKNGAQAVVAAGWSVDDAEARMFAASFYKNMLAGETFGSAVRDARTKLLGDVSNAQPNSARAGSMTWAAYQCYGDPGYRIETPQSSGTVNPPLVVSQDEFLRQIQTYICLAADVGRPLSGSFKKAAEQYRDSLGEMALVAENHGWLDAFGCSLLGKAFADLGDLTGSVTWYRRAIAEEKAGFPMTALEQLGNMEIRLAQEDFRRDGRLREDLITESLHHLQAACGIGETSERFALLGSYYKKLATMRPAAERPELVQKSVENYQKGEDRREVHSPAKPGSAPSYFATNVAQLGRFLDRPVDDDARRRFSPQLADEMTAALVSGSGPTDFWRRAAPGDVLLGSFILGNPDVTEQQVVGTYQSAFRVRSSWRERSSVLDHLCDVADLCVEPKLKASLTDMVEQLRTWIHDNLEQSR